MRVRGRAYALQNHFYGRAKLSWDGFCQLAGEFDRVHACEKSSTYTSFAQTEDGRPLCVLNWIIEREERYETHVAFPGDGVPEAVEDTSLLAVIVFDEEHCWLEKQMANRWFVLDSRAEAVRQIKRPRLDVNLYRIYICARPRS